MRKVKYFCDFCGKEITGDGGCYNIVIRNVQSGEDLVIKEDMENPTDYCYSCVFASIQRKSNRPVVETPEGNKKQADVKLDDAMIVSLRDAGWMWQKIADEIKLRQHITVSDQTVANHYKKAKEAKAE